MKLMRASSFDHFLQKSKPQLLRYMTSILKKMSHYQLAYLSYLFEGAMANIKKGWFNPMDYLLIKNIRTSYQAQKSKLPRLRKTKRKALPYNGRIDKRRKKKRKFSRKQLAAQRLFAKRARAGTLKRRRR